MKKIVTILFLLLPVLMPAQNRHHPEVGAGFAIHKELLFENSFKEDNALEAYAKYRYDLGKGFSVGAMYSFVLPHKHPYYMNEGEDNMMDLTFKINSHTLDAIAEYKTERFGPMCLFAELGGGAQMCYIDSEFKSLRGYYYALNVYACVGLEFLDHLRVTAGHVHDLHYPFEDLSRGTSYYYFALGWSF